MECPICEQNVGINLLEIWKDYKLYHCSVCDVVFSYPMKNPGPEWYGESEMYTLGKTFQQRTAWYHDQFLQEGKIYGEMLLDVGCGTGIFLNEAQKLGYLVVGIDFDMENVKIAKERFGLDEVYPMTLDAFITAFPNVKFDVITLFEVLEHIDNPNQFLKLIKTVLKPGGYIALSMPNRERFLDPLGEGDYPPNHLTRWSAFSLKTFLEGRGFETIKLVIKKLEADDVMGFLKARIRFGIAHRIVQRSKIHHDATLIHRAATLMEIKDFVFKIITMPLSPFLRIFKLQGAGLYCLARLG